MPIPGQKRRVGGGAERFGIGPADARARRLQEDPRGRALQNARRHSENEFIDLPRSFLRFGRTNGHHGPRGERPNLLPEIGAVGKNVDAAAHRGADSAQTGDESGERRSLGRLSEELHRIRCDHAGFDRPYAGA